MNAMTPGFHGLQARARLRAPRLAPGCFGRACEACRFSLEPSGSDPAGDVDTNREVPSLALPLPMPFQKLAAGTGHSCPHGLSRQRASHCVVAPSP